MISYFLKELNHDVYSDFGCDSSPLSDFYGFQCFDSFSDSSHAICPECAMLCHGNHNIKRVIDHFITRHGYFCDCGAGQLHKTHPCLICKQPGPNDQCTFFASNKQTTQGKYYICKTCSGWDYIFGGSSSQICPSCANFCHSGHELEEEDGDYICGQGHLRNTCLFS